MASRSQETLDVNRAGNTINQKTIQRQTIQESESTTLQRATIQESESTTLNINGATLDRHGGFQNSIAMSSIISSNNNNLAKKKSSGILNKFVMPFKRRQINRLRSASPPKPLLKLCTENYIVYS